MAARRVSVLANSARRIDSMVSVDCYYTFLLIFFSFHFMFINLVNFFLDPSMFKFSDDRAFINYATKVVGENLSKCDELICKDSKILNRRDLIDTDGKN